MAARPWRNLMKRASWLVVAGSLMATMSACGGSSVGGGSPLEAQIQGTWLGACQAAPASSERLAFTFSGLAFSRISRSYANVTCTEPGTVLFTDAGSLVIGAAVTASLGTTSVTAYPIDVSLAGFPGSTAHDLAYVDTTASPNRLYLGDSSGANTGNTPATRPTTLDGTSYLVKQ
jgi:hypothetical protein